MFVETSGSAWPDFPVQLLFCIFLLRMWLYNSLVVEQTNGIQYIHELSLSVASLPSMYEWWTGLEWNGRLCGKG